MSTRKKRVPGGIHLAAIALALAALGAQSSIRPAGAAPIDWNQAKTHWSFECPKPRAIPAVHNRKWPRQTLDRFILARLEKAGLTPSPAVGPRALIRRVTFDLTGLPPTPEEVEVFVKEYAAEPAAHPAPGAYERLVDRLLASPRFGERMASIWLPLARYGEDQAHQVGNDTTFFYPNAYLYRQWVVEAFNRDLPYDEFVKLQLAADLYSGAAKGGQPGVIRPGGAGESTALPAAGKIPALPAAIATPALSAGGEASTVSPDRVPDEAALGFLGLGPKYYDRGRLDVMADEWSDRIDTTTRTFLGLTVACARCHDHKYDPITQQDYYALAGVFASTKMVNLSPDGKDIPGNVEAPKMPKGTVHVVQEDRPRDLNVFLRGNAENKGPVVPRRFLRILASGNPSSGDPPPFQQGSGRKELAGDIATTENPLTARVMVNRIWGQFFGTYLVGTPSNFGFLGQEPTNPELLDWLALSFEGAPASPASKGVQQPTSTDHPAWSMKTLVRQLVLSATYRQSCSIPAPPTPTSSSPSQAARPSARKSAVKGRAAASLAAVRPRSPLTVDPTNALMWRMNRRRLTVEQWRDAVLSVSGTLEPGGGPSVELLDPNNHKRTLYARISRLKLNDLLMQFDYPDANVHAEKRSNTTTPTQKLFLMNSPFMQQQAKALAARLEATPNRGTAERVRAAYLLLFARQPSPDEERMGVAFLERQEAAGMPRWERYAQVLLMANEMMYLD